MLVFIVVVVQKEISLWRIDHLKMTYCLLILYTISYHDEIGEKYFSEHEILNILREKSHLSMVNFECYKTTC